MKELNKEIEACRKSLAKKEIPEITQANISGLLLGFLKAKEIMQKDREDLKEKLNKELNGRNFSWSSDDELEPTLDKIFSEESKEAKG